MIRLTVSLRFDERAGWGGDGRDQSYTLGHRHHSRRYLGVLRREEVPKSQSDTDDRVGDVDTVGARYARKKIGADYSQQHIGEHSVAANASAKTLIVNQGPSAVQVGEIIREVSKQLVAEFTEGAATLVDQRLEKFKAETLAEMFGANGGRPEAFSDPDFQYALRDAQGAYARSGDESLHDTLIGLIVERSKSEKRNRLTLVLNDAISKAGLLTDVDFAALAVIFYFKYAVHQGMETKEALAGALMEFLPTIADEFPTDETTYLYMESVGVVTRGTESLQMASLRDLLAMHYPHILYSGLTPAEAGELTAYSRVAHRNLLIQSPVDKKLLIFRNGLPESVARDAAVYGANRDDVRKRYDELVRSRRLSVEQFDALMTPLVPTLPRLIAAYDSSPARNASLTSAGIALAHASWKKRNGFEADIGIWIQ